MPNPGGIVNPGGKPYGPVPELSPEPDAGDYSVGAVEDVVAPAPFPLTKWTVKPSVILYSSSVYSSFNIFPLKINLISSAAI